VRSVAVAVAVAVAEAEVAAWIDGARRAGEHANANDEGANNGRRVAVVDNDGAADDDDDESAEKMADAGTRDDGAAEDDDDDSREYALTMRASSCNRSPPRSETS
jgi:hypothetical protein